MSYIVLARKWRPQNFDEVVGQPHITTTLKNAVSSGRVAHAYLFTGPRGIGKTSTARILSKALNCIQGPTIRPCDKCDPCREIMVSNSLDVLEIDGASNRGIDEIRNLRENVKFAPAKGRFKVYIIDEVHMLTQEAFNALLKTLEEPPHYVKFIFATTQPYKVPPTILSRCQRFDFRRISIKDILSKLENIVKDEKVEVSSEALFYIAKVAEGSMRDAESILDQLISFSDKAIKYDDVISVLGMVSEEVFFELTQALIDKDAEKGLRIIDRVMNEGKDGAQFLANWIDYFRNLMITKSVENPADLIDLPHEAIQRTLVQSQAFSQEELLYILHVLTNIQVAIRRDMLVRVGLEMAVVKVAKREEMVALGEILDKLKELEVRVGEGVWAGESIKSFAGESLAETGKNDSAYLSKNPGAEAPTEPKAEDLNLEKVKEAWPDCLSRVKAQKMSAATFLLEGEPIKVKGNQVILRFPLRFSFHKEVLEEQENRALIEKALSESLARKVKVAFVAIDKAQDVSKRPLDEPKPSSIIQSAIEIFGGKIIKEERQQE